MPANLVSELNSLDFSKYIGGPMQAAVDAQNAASMAQVNFIKEVGLINVHGLGEVQEGTGTGTAAQQNPTRDGNESQETTETTNNRMTSDVRMVDFKYTSYEDGRSVDKILSVPFLTLVSVPALRITEMDIDFNCKLNSVASSTEDKDFSVEGKLSLNVWKIKLNVSASYKYKRSDTEQVERTYSMNVHVKIQNDEMPAGLDRVLNILEGEIKSREISENNNE